MLLPIWGTMRMLEHSECPDFWTGFLRKLHQQSICHLHSSYEYESFALLSECLRRLAKEKITFNHVIKLAEPSFDEAGFSKKRYKSKVQFYERLLPGNIESIQWMWRSEGDDANRVQNFLKQSAEIDECFTDRETYCFPYSTNFAQKAIEMKNLNGLIVYWNSQETEYLDCLKLASENNKMTYVLRPFAAGNTENKSTLQMLNYCKAVPSLKGIIFTATKAAHLKQAIAFFTNV